MARSTGLLALQQRLAARAAADRDRDRLVQKLRCVTSGQPAQTKERSAELPGAAGRKPAATLRFRLKPKRVDEIEIVSRMGRQSIPHVAATILRVLLESQDRKPVCILLPSTENVAEFVAVLAAVECLAVDYPARKAAFLERLKAGTRLRALPDGNVYISGQRQVEFGQDGIYLHYTEKDSLESNGRHWVRIEDLLRYEPTSRKIPISRSSIRLSKPRPSLIDELAGVRAFGNTALYQTRVALVATRTDLDRLLGTVDLAAIGARAFRGELQHAFARGAFDESGQPYVLHPTGAQGAPLVAVAPDFEDLGKTALNGGVSPGSLAVISNRFDLALRSLDVVNRIAERQRVVLLVDSCRRQDIIPLRRHEWHLWELHPRELLPSPSNSAQMPTGIIGLDETLRCAMDEQTATIGFTDWSSSSLRAAFESVRRVGNQIRCTEAAAYDDRVQQSLEVATTLFFRASDELSAEGRNVDEYKNRLDQLRTEIPYIRRYFGDSGADALRRSPPVSKSSWPRLKPTA